MINKVKKSTPIDAKIPIKSEHLNHIISVQSRLAEANFDLPFFMNLVVEEMQHLTPATGVVIELVEGDFMVYRAATGTVANHIGLRLAREHSISGLCVKTKEILYSKDTEKDPRVNIQAARSVGARSLVVAPLFHDGATEGVLKILSNKPDAFDRQDIQTLQLMAGLIGSALAHQMFYDTTRKLLEEKTMALTELNIALIELKKAEASLQHLAQHDFLTDLPNRSLFIDRLQIAMTYSTRTKEIIALLFLDIDHFKSINDQLGHSIGDELLKAFASRLLKSVRSSDTVARIGGDEFIIILNKIEDLKDANAVAEKIIQMMSTPFKLKGKKLTISTSIGIAYFNGDKLTAEQLINRADEALYIAKNSGRNTFHIYDDQESSKKPQVISDNNAVKLKNVNF